MKKLSLLLLIVGFGLLFSGCGKWEQPSAVKTLSQTSPETETKVFNLGETVKLGDKILIIYNVADYTEPNEFMQPKEGNKFIIVDAYNENQSSEPISYNLFSFEVQDNNNYKYQPTTTTKEPSFSSGTLQPGRSVRGFVVFEVPVSVTSLELIYTPNWTDFSQTIVKIK